MFRLIEVVRFPIRKFLDLNSVLLRSYFIIGEFGCAGILVSLCTALISIHHVNTAMSEWSYRYFLLPIAAWVGFYFPLFTVAAFLAILWVITKGLEQLYYFAYPEKREKQKIEVENNLEKPWQLEDDGEIPDEVAIKMRK